MKCLGAELSGHFGTSTKVSWCRSVLGLKCPVTFYTQKVLFTMCLFLRFIWQVAHCPFYLLWILYSFIGLENRREAHLPFAHLLLVSDIAVFVLKRDVKRLNSNRPPNQPISCPLWPNLAREGELFLTKIHLDGVYCCLCWVKDHNWVLKCGAHYPPLSSIRAKFSMCEYTRGILYLAKFCLDCFILLPLQGKNCHKTAGFDKIFIFQLWRLLYPPPLLIRTEFALQEYTHCLHLHVNQHSMVAPPSCIETKLNVSAQLQTFLFPMVSKAFPYSDVLVL